MARPRTDIAPRIIEAARQRFKQSGVEGSSLRAVARDAGTSIGMIYYYFPTKDDLFFAVIEATYAKFLKELEQIMQRPQPIAERLLALFERLGAASAEEQEVLRLVVQEALLGSPRFERVAQRFVHGHLELLLGALMEGVRAGELDGAHHPIVLLLSTMALAGPPQVVRRAFGDKLPAGAVPAGDALARALVNVLLHGIAKPPPRPEVAASVRSP